MKVMVVGAGKLGYKLAEALIYEDVDVTLIDSNSEVLERISEHLDVLTVNANGIEITVLKELEIETYDLLVAATNSDEANTLICSLAKKVGCKKTIARVRNPEYTKQLDFVKSEMGIDYIINPDLATAKEIERYLLKSYNSYSEDFASGKVLMVDFNIKSIESLVGKKLMDVEILNGLLITAISRDGNIIIPNGSTQLMTDDVIYVIGERTNINKLSRILNINIEKRPIKHAMILGGGKVGYYLAEKLSSSNINVTIIEKDKERCEYLSERLNNVLVIHGDGTDLNLLEEENLELMDAFIGVTDYDEQNLLMALMAKQIGVNNTIAKISRPSYVHIIDRMEIDVALNPINIIISDILKFIRGGRVVSVSLLLGEEGEVTEIIASKNMPIVGKPLSKLGLPKGIIIGAIIHDGKVVIPNGESIVNPNDRIVIFCLTKDLPILKKYMRASKGGLLYELWDNN